MCVISDNSSNVIKSFKFGVPGDDFPNDEYQLDNDLHDDKNDFENLFPLHN